ncbi:MAG: retropepsin-like aspartic protease [Marinifilaceae bacterium]|nr:retropepsin-like aspartic protease [Marinifilaceae bacterium]
MEIQVPLEIVELEDNSYHIITTVLIGSIEGDFIIDTGASVTVIDRNTPFSHEAIADVPEINSGGVSGRIEEVKLVNLPTFQIGDYTIENLHAAVIDLDYVNTLYEKQLRRRISGLLGSDFLVKFKAVIDYENKYLRLKVSD